MAKLTLNTVTNPENDTSFANQINANFDAIETAFENTFSRDGTSPNGLSADLDSNNYKITNLATPTNNADAATKAYVDSIASSGVAGADGADGTDGTDGDDGWAPVFSIAEDSDRRVLKLEEWIGGTGTKPAGEGYYVALTGLDATIGNGVDIRGPQGTSGEGTGDLLAANNLSDLDNAATARTNLGLAIGTHVQAYDAGLGSIAGLTTAADKMIYTTGSDTYAVTDLTSTARSLLDDASTSAMRTTLGVAIGSDVQAYDAGLASIAGLTTAANKMIYTTGSDTYAVTDLTAAGRAILDDADAEAQRTTLGLTTVATSEFASQAEAEAGSSNTRVMTPLRVSQAITELGSAAADVVKISSGTVSSAATHDISLVGLTAYRKLVLCLDNWIPATDDTNLWLRTSTNAGSTFDSGVSDYDYLNRSISTLGAIITGLDSANDELVLTPGVGNQATEGCSIEVTIVDWASTTRYTRVFGTGHIFGPANETRTLVLAGARLSSSDVDYIRLLFSSGNIASGTWSLYGWK